MSSRVSDVRPEASEPLGVSSRSPALALCSKNSMSRKMELLLQPRSQEDANMKQDPTTCTPDLEPEWRDAMVVMGSHVVWGVVCFHLILRTILSADMLLELK